MAVFFQIPQIPIDYCAGGVELSGPQSHETAKDSIDVWSGLRDEDDRVARDGVHLFIYLFIYCSVCALEVNHVT